MRMAPKDQEKYIKILEGICSDAPCKEKGGYCILKEIFLKMGPSERVLLQIRFVEVQKWIWGVREGRDIGRDGAWEKWVLEGYAEAFGELYGQDCWETPEELYRLVLDKVES